MISVISLVVISLYTGLSQGIQPLISQNHGAGNKKNVQTLLRYSLITSILLSIVIYGIIFFHAPRLVSVFNSEQDLILASYAIPGLKLRYSLITSILLSIVIYGIIFFHAPRLVSVFNSEQDLILASYAIPGLKLYFTACPFIGFNIVLSTYFISINPRLVSVFNSEQDLILASYAIPGLKLYFTACPFIGFNIVLSTYFISINHPLPAQIISILRSFFVLMPMAWILSYCFGMTGVWLAYPATELFVFLFALTKRP